MKRIMTTFRFTTCLLALLLCSTNTTNAQGFFKKMGKVILKTAETIADNNTKADSSPIQIQRRSSNDTWKKKGERTYFDFVKITREDNDGNSFVDSLFVEPLHDWNCSMDDIKRYMNCNDYHNIDNSTHMMFAKKQERNDTDEEASEGLTTYTILNGKLIIASCSFSQITKSEVLKWFHKYYTLKEKDNSNYNDSYTFYSKNNDTSVNISFTNFNNSEKSNVSIVYMNNI